MQPGRSYPSVALLPNLQEVVDAAAHQAAQQAAVARAAANLPSGTNLNQAALHHLTNVQGHLSNVPQSAGVYPEIALFSQFSQLLQPQATDLSQLQNMSALDALRETVNKGRSRSEGKSSSAYASRHQAAEQRRRTRINERLDRLRKIVPHAERANTATFLEEVIKYIEKLQQQVQDLQLQLAGGAPAGCSQGVAAVQEPGLDSADAAGHGEKAPTDLAEGGLTDLTTNNGVEASTAAGTPAMPTSTLTPTSGVNAPAIGHSSGTAFRPVAKTGQQQTSTPPLSAGEPQPPVSVARTHSSSSSENSGMPLKKRKVVQE